MRATLILPKPVKVSNQIPHDVPLTTLMTPAQGMNISMTDAYNLTWKLFLTLQGLAKPSLLKTYQTERKHIARQLVDFDEKFAGLFASHKGLEGSDFHDCYMENKSFLTGLGHQYPSSVLTDERVDVNIDSGVAERLTPGKRLLPVSVLRHLSGAKINLLDDLPSTAHFHIFVFAGRLPLTDKFGSLASYLDSEASPLTRFSPTSAPSIGATKTNIGTKNVLYNPATRSGTIIDLYLIHTLSHKHTQVASFPSPFPFWQHTIYEDADGEAHKELGVDVGTGALVIVRPDGYVGLVTGLDQTERLGGYFVKFML